MGLALFLVEVVRTVSQVGGSWSLENPTSSPLFKFEPIAQLRGLARARYYHFWGPSTNSGAGRFSVLSSSPAFGCLDVWRRWVPRRYAVHIFIKMG